MQTIICIGPIGSPHTGQALATETWATNSILNVVVVNNNFEAKTRLTRILRSAILPFRVVSACLSNRPDALYLSMKRSMFGLLTDFVAVLAYQTIVRGPVVVHLHGADLDYALKAYFARKVARLLWCYVTDVIVLSPRMIEQLRVLPIRRIHVVKNFSNAFATTKSVESKMASIGKQPMHVVYLSNIMYSKGFLYLIKAIKELQREGQSIVLTMAGLPLRDNWMSSNEALLAIKAELGAGINYLGSVSGGEKEDLLLSADVIALPTFYLAEAQPISLIEGMAFGAVPLTTFHNYNDDFLDPRVAIFVKIKSASAIAEALRELINDPTGRAERVRIAHSTALEQHHPLEFARSIDDIIVHFAIKR